MAPFSGRRLLAACALLGLVLLAAVPSAESATTITVDVVLNTIYGLTAGTGTFDAGVLLYPSSMTTFTPFLYSAARFQKIDNSGDHYNCMSSFYFNPIIKTYPFDTQTVTIDIGAYPQTLTNPNTYPDIVFDISKSTFTFKDDLTVREFALSDPRLTTYYRTTPLGQKVAVLRLNFTATKYYFKQFLRVLAPPILILVVMLFSFSYPLTEMMSRLGASASALLSMMFLTRDQVADTLYNANLSISDSISLVCYVIIGFAVLCNVILLKLQINGKAAVVQKLSRQLELAVWILSPLLFLFLALQWWVVFIILVVAFVVYIPFYYILRYYWNQIMLKIRKEWATFQSSRTKNMPVDPTDTAEPGDDGEDEGRRVPGKASTTLEMQQINHPMHSQSFLNGGEGEDENDNMAELPTNTYAISNASDDDGDLAHGMVGMTPMFETRQDMDMMSGMKTPGGGLKTPGSGYPQPSGTRRLGRSNSIGSHKHDVSPKS